jgi:hypothetical protein
MCGLSCLALWLQVRAALLVLLAHQLVEVRIPKLLQRNAANDAALKSLAKDVNATRERRKSKQTLEQAYAQSAASDDPQNWHYGAPRYTLDIRAVLRRLRHTRFVVMMKDEHGSGGRSIALALLQGGPAPKAAVVASAITTLQNEVPDAVQAPAPAAAAAATAVPPMPAPMLTIKRKRSSSTGSIADMAPGGNDNALSVDKLRAQVKAGSSCAAFVRYRHEICWRDVLAVHFLCISLHVPACRSSLLGIAWSAPALLCPTLDSDGSISRRTFSRRRLLLV